MLATPVAPVVGPGLGPTKTGDMFVWVDQQGGTMKTRPPDGGYYRLEFFPGTSPDIAPSGAPACVPLVPAGRDRQGFGSNYFISFNDAQWTTSGQGYGIALRAKGPTSYWDFSGLDPLSEAPALRKLKAAFQLTGHSTWYVLAGHTRKDLKP